MTRTRIGLALSAAVLGLSGLVGVPAGGPAAAAPVAQPTPTATQPTAPHQGAPPEQQGEHHGMMGLGSVLHGEGTITTKQGTKLVAMQRGTVTSMSDSSLTIKSSDGYTKTWMVGSKVRVFEHRNTLQPSSVKVGSDLTVAGPREGARYTASVIIVSPGGGGMASPS